MSINNDSTSWKNLLHRDVLSEAIQRLEGGLSRDIFENNRVPGVEKAESYMRQKILARELPDIEAEILHSHVYPAVTRALNLLIQKREEVYTHPRFQNLDEFTTTPLSEATMDKIKQMTPRTRDAHAMCISIYSFRKEISDRELPLLREWATDPSLVFSKELPDL